MALSEQLVDLNMCPLELKQLKMNKPSRNINNLENRNHEERYSDKSLIELSNH